MDLSIYMTVDSLQSSTGGPARSVPSLSQALVQQGVSVTLLANSTGDTLSLEESKGQGSTVVMGNIADLSSRLSANQNSSVTFPIVHNHGVWLYSNHRVAQCTHKQQIPLVISPRGMLEPWAMNYKRLRKIIAYHFYQKEDLKRAVVLHATSEQEAKNLSALKLGVPIAVVPNGVELPPSCKIKEAAKQKKRQALFLSRIHPKKGLLLLLSAWHKVLPQDWRLMIIGPDENDYKKKVQQEINRLGLEQVVEIRGEVADNDKWALYKGADLFILPSYSENFGIVVAEALGSGLPVITTKTTPWSDLVDHKCGWWIEPEDGALVEALSEAVMVEPGHLIDMGRRGRKLVKNKYSWDKIAKDMIAVYSWIRNDKNTPGVMY